MQMNASGTNTPIKIKVLILPKFELSGLSGDYPGEAQFYYKTYLQGAEIYKIRGCKAPLCVKNGVALIVTGMGKINASVTLMAVLTDSRFDFSEAYVFSTGCAGSAVGYGTMGDVYVITATIDFDLGHHADARELTTDRAETWFHDKMYDDTAYRILNQELCSKIYNLVKDVSLQTTEQTRRFMAENFNNADWAIRDPKVLKGTAVTSDNYWKGYHGHNNALLMAETYGTPDPYAVTEMEDHALAVVMERMGMLDRYIVIRDSVGTDVFMGGDVPETLWNPDTSHFIASDESTENADIFITARENNFKVGRTIIDAILSGRL